MFYIPPNWPLCFAIESDRGVIRSNSPIWSKHIIVMSITIRVVCIIESEKSPESSTQRELNGHVIPRVLAIIVFERDSLIFQKNAPTHAKKSRTHSGDSAINISRSYWCFENVSFCLIQNVNSIPTLSFWLWDLWNLLRIDQHQFCEHPAQKVSLFFILIKISLSNQLQQDLDPGTIPENG
jgi:hypothetical protein